MNKSKIDKMAGNEVVFRTRNEKINKNIKEYNKTALAENQHAVDTSNDFLFFYCECSNEKCDTRIQVSFTDYDKHHKDRASFVVVPHHDVPEIEEVVSKNDDYWVIKKHVYPPQNTTKLQSTHLEQS